MPSKVKVSTVRLANSTPKYLPWRNICAQGDIWARKFIVELFGRVKYLETT